MTLRFNEPAGADEEFRVANLAAETGIEIHDLDGGLYEISYHGHVDKATLMSLITARIDFATTQIQNLSDSDLPAHGFQRTTLPVM